MLFIPNVIKTLKAAVSTIGSALASIHGNILFNPEYLANQVCGAGATTEIYDFTGANLWVSYLQVSFDSTDAGLQPVVIVFDIDGGGAEQIFGIYLKAGGSYHGIINFPQPIWLPDPGDIDCTTGAGVTGDVTIWGKND